MDSKFDYTATDTPVDVVLSVADSIRSHGRLEPLTDEQKAQRQIEREIRREELAWRAEQRRAERERQQQEQEAIARHEAAVALAEANRKRRLEQLERDKERRRESQVLDLSIQTAQQRGWINSAENSARVGQYLRQRQAIVDELDAMINPPPEPEPLPEPEEFPPEPKIGDPDFFEKWKARSPLRSWPLRTWR